MALNLDKPDEWGSDIAVSIDFFNEWFLRFAPDTYQTERIKAVSQVEEAFAHTAQLTQVTPEVLKQHPEILSILRMTTAPPLARDRLVGLSNVDKTLVNALEKGKLPKKVRNSNTELEQLARVINKLLDTDLFPWIEPKAEPDEPQIRRAATVVADRFLGARANPLIRNAQEKRQLSSLQTWLEARGYRLAPATKEQTLTSLQPGTYRFRMRVRVELEGGASIVNMPIDAVVMPLSSQAGDYPILIEAKSAGDFTNPNKRRKEEADKIKQLHQAFGKKIVFLLMLCGYFNRKYLQHEARDGIDWFWEHRIDDLLAAGV